MGIFIGNAPANLTSHELQQLILDAIAKSRKHWLFWQKEEVPIVLTRLYEKTIQGKNRRYFIAKVEPYGIAELVVQQLNQLNAQGRLLSVREFCSRSYINEQRRPYPCHILPPLQNRREKDRRRTINIKTKKLNLP